MKFHREFAVLISAVICAAAIMFATPNPGLDPIGYGVPVAFNLTVTTDYPAETDATMTALHRQASAALASLQASAAARP